MDRKNLKVRFLTVLVIYSRLKKNLNITYTEKSKILLYGYCSCLIYFINLK